MTEVRAELKNYRQSPRKVRVVAETVTGKSVASALDILTFIPKRAGLPLKKLVSSALANAKNREIPTENLVVKELRVDKGKTLYRSQPRSHGMATPIRKRTSRVIVVLSESSSKAKKLKSSEAKS